MNRLVRLLALIAVVGFVVALSVTDLPRTFASATPSADGCTASYGGSSAGDSWSGTEPLRRSFYDTAGATATKSCFRLTVDKHTDLEDHERITVKWTGAHVTDGRSLNPYGESGLPQEYPVVLMECRGVDPKNYASGKLPSGAKAVAPDTCWTNTYFQRTNSALPGEGIWEQDASNVDDTQHVQGIAASKIPDSCNVNAESDYDIVPFLARNHTLYPGCSAQSMPPEATVSSVSIPNEVYAFTNSDGSGVFPFEVRTSLENQSLGCSATVKCTLEAIPIDGINCDNHDPSAACNQVGDLPPGGVNPGSAPQDAVAPAFWSSASNWDRRVPVPLSFSEPPSVCTIASSGKPVPFYGSELLDQAALQWIPAYCLNRKRFNLQDNVMPDQSAFGLMQHGTAAAAEVSSRGPGVGVGYAPTAVTGWAIGFDVDKPNDAGQQTTLKLNALLLAKLLTESYPGSTEVQTARAAMAHNPLSLNLDPEFERLNPNLDTSHWSEAAATLLATSVSSQTMYELSSYIAADPKAMAFIDGKPDRSSGYVMRVNPAYKGIKLPVDSWPLLDTWQDKTTNNPCLRAQGSSMPPYMPLIANPVASMQLVAQALLYNWPNVETSCTGTGTTNDPFQLSRVASEGIGNRFMLGLVTLGDAQRYGLTTAELQAAPGHYVAADSTGIKAALALEKPTKKTRPFALTQAQIRSSHTAYPGAMVVYTAAKEHGLPATTAKDVSQFIRVSSTQGQQPGRSNGQLAAGYVPITNSGVTKPLYQQARKVASAVAAQNAPTTPRPGSATSPNGPGAGAPVPGAGPPAKVPAGAASGTDSSGTAPSLATNSSPAAVAQGVRTAAVSTGWGRSLPLILLVTGLVASIGIASPRIAARFKGSR
jgi:hypothetical protein